MSWSNPSSDQKIPLPESLDSHFLSRYKTLQDLQPWVLPASVTKIDATGTIVTVKFEVLEPAPNAGMKDLHPLYVLQFPQTEMPVATDLYGIPPLQIGDRGYCIPADVDLGGVSGYYDGVTDTGFMVSLTKQPNLSTLVFHPIGNINAQARPDPSKYYLSGPTGVQIVDLSGIVCVNFGPVQNGIGNAIQILQSPGSSIAGLLNCSSDAEARSQGIPLYGLYHNNGIVHYQYTVP